MVARLPYQWGVVIAEANGMKKAETTAPDLGRVLFFKDAHVLWSPFPVSLEVTVHTGSAFLDHTGSGSASGAVEKRL